MFLPPKYQDYKHTLLNLVLYVDSGIELGSLHYMIRKLARVSLQLIVYILSSMLGLNFMNYFWKLCSFPLLIFLLLIM